MAGNEAFQRALNVCTRKKLAFRKGFDTMFSRSAMCQEQTIRRVVVMKKIAQLFSASLYFALSFFLTLIISTIADAKGTGNFKSELIFRALKGKERVVELVAPFTFEDPNGKLWSVPSGAKVDGASIPSTFWSVIGGPFTGKYREASVIHDYYCDTKTETWEATHAVFYDGMKANGVGSVKANIMYAAVYSFGPRWLRIKLADKQTAIISGAPEQLTKNRLDILKLTAQPDISLQKIRQAVDKALTLEAGDLKLLQKHLENTHHCSVVVAPLGSKSGSMALCKLDNDSQKLLARRNLGVLINDVQLLLSSNTNILLPQIDRYIGDPSVENWKLVTNATQKILGVVNLTMLSLIQYDKALKNTASAGAAGKFFTAARLKRILRTRGRMLEKNTVTTPRSGQKLQSWKRVYLELLQRLERQLIQLKKKIG